VDSGIGNAALEIHALGADAGTAAVTEGCLVLHTRRAYYHDTGTTKDSTVRNNYFSDAYIGINYSLGSLGQRVTAVTYPNEPVLLKSVIRDTDPTIAVVTNKSIPPDAENAPHGLLQGSAVSMLVQNPASLPNYTGYWDILDTPSAYKFRYQLAGNPGADGTGDPLQYQEFWRTRLLVHENNIIEVTTDIPSAPYGYGILFQLAGPGSPASFPMHLQNVVRGNIIRQLKDVQDGNNFGISITKAKSGLTEQNVIDMDEPNAAIETYSGLTYFANERPSGAFLQGRDDTNARFVDELTTLIEDSLILSF
jgi:hypothetical protein